MKKKFTIPIYELPVYFSTDEDFTEKDDTVGVCYEDDGSLYISIKSKVSYYVVAHECYHAVDMVCRYLEIPFTQDTDEPRAYLFEFLFKKCIKLIEKEKKKGN